jgi:plasmid stabilization system protein ParE
MPYRIAVAEAAEADAEYIYEWVLEQAPRRGPEWFDELVESLNSLERLPRRCPLAREAKELGREIRCLHFGRRHGVYRILYEIDEKSRTVWILHIRHGARRDLVLED